MKVRNVSFPNVEYDSDTGYFTRIHDTQRKCAGSRMETAHNSGYYSVRIGSVKYLAHRLAFLLLGTEIPPKTDVDHINGDKLDNRLSNLRLATRSQNKENTTKPRSHNRSGVLGVRKRKTCWSARICISGKEVNLGRYATESEAYAAYVAAKRVHHKFGTL